MFIVYSNIIDFSFFFLSCNNKLNWNFQSVILGILNKGIYDALLELCVSHMWKSTLSYYYRITWRIVYLIWLSILFYLTSIRNVMLFWVVFIVQILIAEYLQSITGGYFFIAYACFGKCVTYLMILATTQWRPQGWNIIKWKKTKHMELECGTLFHQSFDLSHLINHTHSKDLNVYHILEILHH